MSYFNHAFCKMFLGIKTGSGGQDPNIFAEAFTNDVLTQAAIDYGFVTSEYVDQNPNTTKLHSSDLAKASMGMGPGVYAFFDPDSYEIVMEADLANCCPLVLVSSAVRVDDKIGPYHGGYAESNKSKKINPRYISKYYRVDPCQPEKAVLSIGRTPYTEQESTADADCCKQFYCGETYYLRVDVKGSPALRFLNHNMYKTVDAYTGCCPGDVPTLVDPTTVYLQWAKQLVNRDNGNWYQMVAPVVYDYTGAAWFAPGTTVSPIDGSAVVPAQWWETEDDIPVDNYAASAQALAWTDQYTCDDDSGGAGIRIVGAYVETKFQNCTFTPSDHYELEPLQIYASLVDYTGDPCLFEGLCVYDECKGLMGQGFGETVIRGLILSESYLTNFFADDKRIREITGGNDNFIVDRISSGALYTRYFIQHNVPRYNNPSGTFDNDQYLLEIVTLGQSASLESFMDAWIGDGGACVNCPPFETHDCVACTPADEPALP